MRSLCLIFTIAALQGCSNAFLPDKQELQVLGIEQKYSESFFIPNEYVFCDLVKGAWRCPTIDKKTPYALTKNTNKTSSNIKGGINKEAIAKLNQLEINEIDSIDSISIGDLLGKAHFEFDKYNLTEYSKGVIDAFIPLIKEKNVIVLGYTDNVGVELYNDNLAQKRAAVVANYLVKKGLNKYQIHAEGNGICCYLVPNGTDKQRSINRRAEVRFVN